jgi:hypothetical protein
MFVQSAKFGELQSAERAGTLHNRQSNKMLDIVGRFLVPTCISTAHSNGRTTKMKTRGIAVLLFLLAFAFAPINVNAQGDTLRHAPVRPVLAFSFDDITSPNIPDDSGSGHVYTIVAQEASGNFTPATVRSFTGSGQALHLVQGTGGVNEQRIEADDGVGLGDPLTMTNGFTIMADVNLTGNDTDPIHKRWEISEKAGSYWANIRYDVSPPERLRVGGFFAGNGDETFTGSNPVPPGVWTNVAFVFDPVAHLFLTYINGVLDHTKIRNGTLDNSTSNNGIDEKLVVGAKHRLGGAGELLEAFFDGDMDNYRLYNVPLRAAQIAVLAGTPVKSRRQETFTIQIKKSGLKR